MKYFALFFLLLMPTVSTEIKEITNKANNPSGIFLYNDYLYYSEFYADAISRISLTNPDAQPEKIVTGLSAPYGLAIKDDFLYFAQHGVVSRLNLANPNSVLYDFITTISRPTALLIDGDKMYIGEWNNEDFGRVHLVDLSQHDPKVEVILFGMNDPSGLAISGDILFIADSGNKLVYRADLSGTDQIPTPYITTIESPNHLAIYEDNLYIGNFGYAEILKTKINGSTANTGVIVEDYGRITGLATNELGELYFASFDRDIIYKYSLCGVSTNKPNPLSNIKIYPNPVADFLVIENLDKETLVKLITIDGKIIKSAMVSEIQKWDIGDLASGTYFIQAEGMTPQKFIKQ